MHPHSFNSHHHRGIRPSRRSLIQPPDIPPPLRDIRPQHPPIVRQQTIDLALDIRRLRPDAAAAGILHHLVAQLVEETMSAVIPRGEVGVDLVGLVDGVEGGADVPETEKEKEWSVRAASTVPGRLTGRSRHCSRYRQIRPGYLSYSGRMGLTGWSRKESRIAGWRNGGCPI